MENQDLKQPVKETIADLKDYLDLQINYQKMMAAKKTSKLSSFSALFLILFILIASLLFFLSFAFVLWYAGDDNAKMSQGYLIVAGFYGLLAFIVIIFRKQLLVNPIHAYLTDLFFDKDNSNITRSLSTNVNLKDEEAFEKILEEEKEKIKEMETVLQYRFKEVEKNFSVANLLKIAGSSLVNTYLTTATVARLAFKAVGGLKRKKKLKQKNN